MIIAQISIAQDINDAIKSLQVNSSPAFVILGVEPENIQRPNSPSEFAANIQSATVNNTLATNFAMETTPYWWGKKESKKFNILDYLTASGRDDYFKKVAQSITISAATSATDSMTFGTLKPGTGLALGFRVQLFSGHLSPQVERNLTSFLGATRTSVLYDELIGILEQDEQIDDIEDWVDERIADHPDLASLPDPIKEVIKERFLQKAGKHPTKANLKKLRDTKDVLDKKAAEFLAHVNEFKLPLTREGFMLELAGASARVASNLEWSDMIVAKRALWLTPSYRFNVNEKQTGIDIVDIMGVIRWTNNNDAVDESDYVDAGGKLQYIHERWSLSGEGVYRFATKKPEDVDKSYTYRTAVTFTYKLNDLITFKVTGGKKFNGTTVTYDEPQRVFLVGGFNFGVSKLMGQKE